MRSTCAGAGSRMDRIARPTSMKLPDPVPPAVEARTTTRSSCSMSRCRSVSCCCRPMLFSTALPCSRTMCWNRVNWSKNSSRAMERTWPAPFSVLMDARSPSGSQARICG